ncbi:MAG: tetratricopeptide repeat protein [Gelidibacter sp.]|nr:tetratricopeptide repeat protein [Gelidibacter sp.]
MKNSLITLFLVLAVFGCSKNVKYTPEHIKQTSGRYLFNQEEVIDVYYDDNDLYLNWKSGRIKPVVLDENTFFVPDMYKKLRFVVHPTTKKRYLGIVPDDDDTKVDYAYLKVADTFKTPSMYLKNKQYDEAIAGYMQIHQQDSTSMFLNERRFNSIGYGLLRERDYDNAIKVFQMNVALYPLSDNVYDSLADAYLRSGDSLQAFTNYQKALQLNAGNERARTFVENYDKKE